jgi:hypothetical protein
LGSLAVLESDSVGCHWIQIRNPDPGRPKFLKKWNKLKIAWFLMEPELPVGDKEDVSNGF